MKTLTFSQRDRRNLKRMNIAKKESLPRWNCILTKNTHNIDIYGEITEGLKNMNRRTNKKLQITTTKLLTHRK